MNYTKKQNEKFIVEKTIREMNPEFTSFEFCQRAVENGFSKEYVRSQGMSKYIREHAKQNKPNGRVWTKKEKGKIIVEENLFSPSISERDVQKMINTLKLKGYKIQKPVTEFVEC